MDVIRLDMKDKATSGLTIPSCEPGDYLSLIQLRHVLPQILAVYSVWSANVYLENGTTVTGLLRELIPVNEKADLVRISANQYVPLSGIAAIRIPGAYYDGCFDYLRVPDGIPENCYAARERAIRAALCEDGHVQIRAGGQIVSNELVMESVFGMIVTACYNGIHPTFISSSHIDSFTIR
jgi:hypothetical protein